MRGLSTSSVMGDYAGPGLGRTGDTVLETETRAQENAKTGLGVSNSWMSVLLRGSFFLEVQLLQNQGPWLGGWCRQLLGHTVREQMPRPAAIL